LFWTVLREVWPRWSDVLAIVKPESPGPEFCWTVRWEHLK
jgi:hypothetical protein